MRDDDLVHWLKPSIWHRMRRWLSRSWYALLAYYRREIDT